MNVYIYGNKSFKKEIHETLEHANIKFKLDSDSVIKDISDLNELKEIIRNNPNDIYLIDDEKIIKKNGITKKIKFLTPKDGIEEEFLLDNGIADLSVDSLKEIPKYILQKHEQQKTVSPEIQESIADIVDEAYSEDAKQEELIEEDKKDDEDIFELDDELAQLLSKGEESTIEVIENDNSKDEDLEVSLDDINSNGNNSDSFEEVNIDNLDSNELDSLMNFNEDVGLNNVDFDYDDKDIVNDEPFEKIEDDVKDEISDVFDDLENDDIMKELDSLDLDEKVEDEFKVLDEINHEDFDLDSLETNNEEIKEVKIEEPKKGVGMSDDFSELDSLSEADILSALDGLDNVNIVKEEKSTKKPVAQDANNTAVVSTSSDNLDLSSSSSDDIANLISKLLNNKTLEITIKIKD